MAVVGALNQLVAGLHSGIDAGFQYGEKGRAAYGQRKMGKAEAELEKYMDYDPTVAEGAIDADGNPTMKQPNITDLMALRREYNAAARATGDPDAIQRAEERWATQLKTGADSYLNQALRALEAGDHGTVKRALEHANGFIPNGVLAEVGTNEEGQVVVKGYNELNGDTVIEKEITKEDIMAQLAYGGDPEKTLQYIKAQTEFAAGLREKTAAAERQARLDRNDEAKLLAEIQEMKASALEKREKAGLHARTPGVGSADGARMANLQIKTQQVMEKAVSTQIDGSMFDERQAQAAMRHQNKIHAIGAQMVLRDNVPFHVAAQEAIELAIRYDEALNNGNDAEFVRQFDQMALGNSGSSQGIPVE